MNVRILLVSLFFVTALFSGTVHAEPKHASLYVDDITVQLPYAPRVVKDDLLVDVNSLQGVLPLNVEKRGTEWVIRYAGHQLEIQPGRVAAMLDGKWLLLRSAPVIEMDALLVPNRQLFDLLTIPYTVKDGNIITLLRSDTISQLQKEVSRLEGNQAKIGLLGVLQPNRWIVALHAVTAGKTEGFGNLYEVARETTASGKDTWKLIKLRTISDTAGQVYMEWMPNGSIFENIAADKRPEFLVVETCNCVGGYKYGTMFTITEMGLTPVWHSQATYVRVKKTAKGHVLVTHRKDAILTRTSATMPYWEIYEKWSGQSFRIIKQEYIDPQGLKH